MNGGREKFTCAACGKPFTYWILQGNEHPKVKCCYCGKDFFPRGEPVPVQEPAVAAPASVATPTK